MTGANPTRVPFHRPSLDDETIDAVAATLRSGWLTTGPQVSSFEAEFAAAVGARHAVALSSCTAAMHLALLAHNVGAGDEVLVPTMTFAAGAEVVLAVGATPVFVDADPATLTIDVDDAERRLTPRTAAIMPMHYGGRACDMEAILTLQYEYPGVTVIEDAAHAFPTRFGSQRIGSMGDATCFSFYANKPITTSEGGMLTTDDARVAERVRRLSLHGLSRDAWTRFETRRPWDYDIIEPGWKYNMSEVAATIGRAQLASADELASQRRSVHRRYDAHFADHPRIRPLEVAKLDDSAAHLYVVRVPERDLVADRLAQAGIGTSVHYRPLHLHSFHRRRSGGECAALPVATQSFSEILSLPIFPDMTSDEVDLVTDVLTETVADIAA